MITVSSVPATELEAGREVSADARRRPGLLCVANYAANTGYAWRFIEEVYGALADHFAEHGVSTWVAYPRVEAAPAALRGSAALPVELDVRLDSWRNVARVLRFIRRADIRAVYLPDHPAWRTAYVALRLAGVRWIVVHDHTSGARTIPTGLKRWLKRRRRLVTSAMADRVVAVSDFVARRKTAVDLIPAERVQRIWNSALAVERSPNARNRMKSILGIESGPIVGCACRATPEKGVAHLLRAFDRVSASLAGTGVRPTLVYIGDGPAMAALRELRSGLRSAGNIVFAGFRPEAAELLAGADLCVVPSAWQEAFGLAALEPMAYGIPVIASRVGGIPEVVVHGETGLLTEPGDEAGLEEALLRLLLDPAERQRMGRNGLIRARTVFGRDEAIRQLLRVLEPGLSPGFES